MTKWQVALDLILRKIAGSGRDFGELKTTICEGWRGVLHYFSQLLPRTNTSLLLTDFRLIGGEVSRIHKPTFFA